MRILYFSQYFPPEVGASQIRAFQTAQGLIEAGHQVTVIAGVPNHPHGIIHPGYGRKWFDRRDLEGLDVIYVWVKTAPRKNFLTRVAFYLSYMLLAIIAGLFVARDKYDLVFATSPPLFVGGAGLAVTTLRRPPFVFEAIDLWPEAAVTVGELNNPHVIRWATRLEEACYRRARKVIVTAQEMVDRLIERNIPADKLVLVRNGAKLSLFKPDSAARQRVRRELELENKFVLLFAGLHGLAYDLLGLIEVAHTLRDEPDIHFLFVGHGVQKEAMQQRAEALALPNVTFLPIQPYEEVAAFFNAADTLVVPMNDPHIMGTLPVKIYDAMACELPVLVAATGEPQFVVEEAQAGVVVAPHDYEAMRRAILHLRDNPDLRQTYGRQGRQAVIHYYSIDVQVARFVQALETV